MTRIAHLTPIAYSLRWQRHARGVSAFSAPGWRVEITKNHRTNRFEARAISDHFNLLLGESRLQRDAKATAKVWSDAKWLDYAEAFNSRQEAAYSAPTREAADRLRNWERNVSKGHREAALLGARTEAAEIEHVASI